MSDINLIGYEYRTTPESTHMLTFVPFIFTACDMFSSVHQGHRQFSLESDGRTTTHQKQTKEMNVNVVCSSVCRRNCFFPPLVHSFHGIPQGSMLRPVSLHVFVPLLRNINLW